MRQQIIYINFGIVIVLVYRTIKPSLSENLFQRIYLNLECIKLDFIHYLSIINPFMPYVTETLSKEYFPKESLIVSKWPEPCLIEDNNIAKNEINFLISLLTEIR